MPLSAGIADHEAQRDGLTHGLPADPAMPGFCAALDAATMARLVRAHVLPQDVAILGLRIVRFRHRPGERLVVSYEADITDADGASPHRLILTGRIHPRRSAGSGRAGSRSTFIPELAMTLEAFPEDRRLPALRKFVTEPGEAWAGLAGMYRPNGLSSPCSMSIEPMRYRPGLSATLRCRFAGDAGGCGPETLFVKFSADGDVAAEAATAGAINAALAHSGDGLRLSVPEATDAANGVAVYRPARGHTIQDLLAGDSSPEETGRRTGEALAKLHTRTDLRLPQTFSWDVTSKIERAERITAWACPELSKPVHGMARLARLLVTSDLAMPTHRDMKPDHVFLDHGGGVEMIDVGSVSTGNPMVDIGSMLARLDLLTLDGRVTPNRSTTAKAALLASYLDQVPHDWRAFLAPAYAYGALLVATHAIEGVLPGWRKTVTAFVGLSLAWRG